MKVKVYHFIEEGRWREKEEDNHSMRCTWCKGLRAFDEHLGWRVSDAGARRGRVASK